MMNHGFSSQDVEAPYTPRTTGSAFVGAGLPEMHSAVLLEWAHAESVKWRSRKRKSIICYGALLPISLVVLLGVRFLPNPVIPLSLSFLALVCGLIGLLTAIVMRPLRNNPINGLWVSEDVGACGPLLECTRMMMPEMARKANAALARLLPRMESGDLLQLTPYQRRCLRQLIDGDAVQEPNYDSMRLEGIPAAQVEGTRQMFRRKAQESKAAVIPVLRILEQFGTEQDLAVVSKLAEGRGAARGDAEIQAAAVRCLEALHATVSRGRGSETFLRPSGPPTVSGDELLRHATTGGQTDPESLLRAEPSLDNE